MSQDPNEEPKVTQLVPLIFMLGIGGVCEARATERKASASRHGGSHLWSELLKVKSLRLSSIQS